MIEAKKRSSTLSATMLQLAAYMGVVRYTRAQKDDGKQNGVEDWAGWRGVRGGR